MDKIKIEVDLQEKFSKIIEILEHYKNNIIIKEKTLSAGDYCINNRIIIERKTTKDFIKSIIDGRLFSQAKKMKNSCFRAIIIIEGNDLYNTGYKIDNNAIKGAIISLVSSWYIPIIYSKDINETARFLLIIGQQDLKYFFCAQKSLRKKPKKIEKLKLHVLQSLPTIGHKIAINMLNHFKTVEHVMIASEKELAKVEKIGIKKAKIIKEIISS